MVAASKPFLLIILMRFFSLNTNEKVKSVWFAINLELPTSAITTALVPESIKDDFTAKSSLVIFPNLNLS